MKKLRALCTLDRLARLDQKIPEGAPVESKHQNTWLANRRAAATIESDFAKLPKGAVATVDGVAIPQKHFARDFLETADAQDVRRLVDMLARSTFMDDLLHRKGKPLTEADLDVELASRKKEFESKPQYRGVDFAEIVKQSTWLTVDQWKHSRGFRLEAGYSKLAEATATQEDLLAFYEKHIDVFGPTYTVKHLLVRGARDPSAHKGPGPAPQPIEKARAQVEALAADLRSGRKFEDLVQLYSEDTATKLTGGLLEPFTAAAARRFHEPFQKAVAALEVGAVSGPVETPDGVHLIKLERKDPPPPSDMVSGVLKREVGLETFRALWDAATYGVNVRFE
jgi:foldase protein PrsA